MFRNFWLHMDNASPHTAVPTKNYLLQTGTQVLPHPPYSPDMAPNDFYFYPWLKHFLKGWRFGDAQEVEDAVDEAISHIPSLDFQETMLRIWPKRWARCVNASGVYFEGLRQQE